MKSIFGTFILAICLFSFGYAQQTSSKLIPQAVKASFEKLHPNTRVKWDKEGDAYEAAFTLNGKETAEVYDRKGMLLETEVSIQFSELPAAVRAKLVNMKVAETAKITKADGTVLFEAEVKGNDLLFDANGKSVKH